MSHKARQLVCIYAAAAIMTLAVYSSISHVRLENYRLIAKYSSQRAFEETAASVDALSAALEKGVYAADAGMCAKICGEIQAAAQAAEAAMATLPFSTHELNRTAGFLGTAADYAQSLALQGSAPDEEQRGALRSLSDKAAELSRLMQELRGSINDGALLIDRQEELLRNIGGEGEGVRLSTRLTDYESDFDMPDMPEYDGRFTAQKTRRKGELSDEQMLAAAAEFIGAAPEELRKEYSYEGESRLRCYSAGTKYVFVSSAGVEGMADSRLIEEARMDIGQARTAAEEFLSAQGYDKLELSGESSNGSAANFEYIRVDETSGAACQSGVIRIAIALDTGEPYSFDASGFSETEIGEEEWRISEDEAREKLPAGLEAESCRRVVISSEGGKPIACYELSCRDGEKRVRIYIKASDGLQQEILVDYAQRK